MGFEQVDNSLRTEDPIALRYLMSEVLFDFGEVQEADPADSVVEADSATVDSASTDSAAADSAVVVDSATAASTVVPALTRDSEPVISTNKKPELSFLGQNSSGFLFVFQDPSQPGQHRLPEAEMEAFEKILAALKLSLADVALINIAGPQGLTAGQLLDYFRPLKVVLLSTQISLEGHQKTWPELTLHQIYAPKIDSQSSESAPQVLHSYSFAEMMDDVAKKRTFWSLVKALLG